MSTTQDPYAILGVARNADAKAIKSAYHRLALEHH
jgi:curved DNA-binding protein CbpA